MKSSMESPLGKFAALCAAASFFAGCEKSRPVPVDGDALCAPTASALVGKQVLFDGRTTFQEKVDRSYWFQPPPLIISNGKSVTVIPQPGHTVKRVDYNHRIEVPSSGGGFIWNGVDLDRRVPDGTHKLTATFKGNSDTGAPVLQSFEVISCSETAK